MKSQRKRSQVPDKTDVKQESREPSPAAEREKEFTRQRLDEIRTRVGRVVTKTTLIRGIEPLVERDG